MTLLCPYRERTNNEHLSFEETNISCERLPAYTLHTEMQNAYGALTFCVFLSALSLASVYTFRHIF